MDTENVGKNPETELLEAAFLARTLARTLCRSGNSPEGCDWYHGSWPFLRLLNGMATSEVHGAFYRAEVARMAIDPAFASILITGSADYSMLKLLAESWPPVPGRSAFTVLDLCATPLALCRWYGEKAGVPVVTVHQDILDSMPAEQFDAVFTHAFMGNFDDDDRERLIRQWAHVLRRGGRVVTVQRVREGFRCDRVGFTHAEAGAFTAQVQNLVQKRPIAGIDAHEIVEMARVYTERFSSFPIRSSSGLEVSFLKAGFRLERFERTVGSGVEGVTGPSVPNTNGYYLISAQRV